LIELKIWVVDRRKRKKRRKEGRRKKINMLHAILVFFLSFHLKRININNYEKDQIGKLQDFFLKENF